METVKTILVLAANPKNTARLRLDQEVREIEEGLRRSAHRDQFNIQSKWAVTLRDLRRTLLDIPAPKIVHFCGHGETRGIMVEDEAGQAKFVSPEALSGLFELFKNEIELVLLNACYSGTQLDAIRQHIDYVIGMKQEIDDKSALEFAIGFYDGLGAGKSVEDAFKLGCNAIQLDNLPEHLTPILKRKLTTRESTTVSSISGIEAFYSKRCVLSPTWWEKFYAPQKNPKEVIFMGQSITAAFHPPQKPQVQALIKWCNNGTKARILFLSPGNPELSQLQHVGKGIIQRFTDDPTQNLVRKIYKSIEDLEENVIAKIDSLSKKPLVRFSTRELPFSLMLIDDEMLVTLYGVDVEGDNQATFFIKGTDTDAYRRFKAEFELIWSEYSKVHPYEDPVVTGYKKDWGQYVSLKNYSMDVPPPRQAIIFPNYHCQESCSYCTFQHERSADDTEEMILDTFKDILLQLIDFGVRRFEISGGGEPLEHQRIDSFMACLDDIRESYDDIKLGLLTNGRHLNKYPSERILSIFNDYVRINRYENLEQRNKGIELTRWKQNIQALLTCKRNHPTIETKIGIKYLLTLKNKDYFVEMVQEDLRDMALSGIEHFRFRSERRVDSETIAKVEQQVYNILTSAKLPDFQHTVSLSLPNVGYPRNFRCWVSPMHVVIAPNGEVYLCPNYLYDKNNKCLGNIQNQEFKNIWRAFHHKELRERLNRANCDRDEYCNCRYAEVQNIFDRIALTIEE
ncbi:hypothetical protein TFLX_05306 [Thermoflexales bacterium]|nr:hypothetical protein TFLX_05306 [Thermoflexales bacterium]